MTEILSAGFRGVNLFTLAFLVGGPLFLLFVGPHPDVEIANWRARWRRIFPWVLAVNLVTAAAILILQLKLTVDRSMVQLLASRELLESFLSGTRYGRISAIKFAAASLMVIPCLVLARTARYERTCLFATLLFATLTGLIGPLSGHAAGGEQSLWLMPLHMLHICAVAAWLGGLPLWISLIRRIGRSPERQRCAYTARALERFSRLAFLCMAAIVGSGVLLTLGFVETMGDLLGTPYGLLVCGKIILLVGVLYIANHARRHFLPVLAQGVEAGKIYPLAGRWVASELLLSTIILGFAGILSQTTPAIHDQPIWWLPFRISIDATWPVAPVPVIVSAASLVLSIAVAVLALRWRSLSLAAKRAGVITSMVAAGILLRQISVQAYPDTYRRSVSPYLTVSIVQGKRHFEQYCTACHGSGGLGDGPLANSLPEPPANLSEPHTALHTAGDMFWWLTEGIPEGGMPGFARMIDEQARWDLINFLRAFSQGFEARLIGSSIEPVQPWLGAPNFYFEAVDGEPRELKDFRGNSNVLLVFPGSSDIGLMTQRTRALADARNLLQSVRTEVLVVRSEPVEDLQADLIYVQTGADEIREAYDLLSRTVFDRGDGRSLGMSRQHMEFLIDRFGYIRARWIPDDQSEGWRSIERLRQEAVRLNEEPRIRPPPEDHVH